MKHRVKYVAGALLICSLVFTGCGAKEQATEEKTYNYSEQYAAAVEQLDNSVIDEDTYRELSDALASYSDMDLTALSKKEAKALKETLDEVSAYYEASAQVINDTLAQMGQVYPTEDGFYDDAFKESATALLDELNHLMEAGKYKDAAAKLNEITAAYSAYVESKGQTVSADVTVDASKTASVKKSTGTTTANKTVTASAGTAASGTTASAGSTGGGTSNAGPQNNTAANNKSVADWMAEEEAKQAQEHAQNFVTYTCPTCGQTFEYQRIGAEGSILSHQQFHEDQAEQEAFAENAQINEQYVNEVTESGTYIDFDTWLRDKGLYEKFYENEKICNK